MFLEIQEAYKFIQMDKDPQYRAKYKKEFNQYEMGKTSDAEFKSRRPKNGE